MDFFQHSDIYKLAVRQIGKPAVYVNNGLDTTQAKDTQIWDFVRASFIEMYGHDKDKLNKAIIGLRLDGLFFFETELEQRMFYNVFNQPLTNSSAIYACTYNKNGECITENT